MLLTAYFVEKFLIFVKFHLSMVSFLDFAISIIFKKQVSKPNIDKPMLSSGSLIVLHFTGKFMIHWELS